MFTYPIMGAGGGSAFLKEEYILVDYTNGSEGSDKMLYVKNNGSALALQASLTTYDYCTSDGTFLFTHAPSDTQSLTQWTWNGTVFVEAATIAITNGGFPSNSGLLHVPGTTNILMAGATSNNVHVVAYQTSPTYTLVADKTFDGVAYRGGHVAAFREVADRGTPVAGSVFVLPYNSQNSAYSFIGTVESGSWVLGGQSPTVSQNIYGPDNFHGYDIDAGISYHPHGNVTTQIDFYEHDIAARTHGARQTCVIEGDELFGVCGVHGLIVTLEVDTSAHAFNGRLRTYSRAGTTLTLIDDLDLGIADPGVNGGLQVSPYTNWIYHTAGGGAGANIVIEVSEAGAISTIIPQTDPIYWGPSNAGKNNLQFLPAAITVTP